MISASTHTPFTTTTYVYNRTREREREKRRQKNIGQQYVIQTRFEYAVFIYNILLDRCLFVRFSVWCCQFACVEYCI